MGCSPVDAVQPLEEENDTVEEDSLESSIEYSLTQLIDRQQRCTSQQGRRALATNLNDDTAVYDRGGDLTGVQICQRDCKIRYASECGEEIIKQFSKGEEISLEIMHKDERYLIRMKRRPEEAVSEEEDYVDYDAKKVVTRDFHRTDQRPETISVEGALYFRRPRTFNHDCERQLDQSLSEEYIDQNGDLKRLHFRRGEHIPHIIRPDSGDEQPGVMRRLEEELCSGDCRIEYFDYTSEKSIVKDHKKGQISRKLLLKEGEDQFSLFWRCIEPFSNTPSDSFSDEFADDKGVIVRRHFAGGNVRLAEITLEEFDAAGQLENRILRNRAAKFKVKSPELSELEEPEEAEKDFEKLLKMDFAADFEGEIEPARKYVEYIVPEAESDVLRRFFYIEQPVNSERLAEEYGIDMYLAKQLLRETGNFDATNVTFSQFERFELLLENGNMVSRGRERDLVEQDFLE